MENLPATRLTPARSFLNCGIDYARPFTIRISRNVTGKAYLGVFVCFASKAVHLEIISDVSTSAFLNALKRFIARRGKCLHIYTDNGKNFIGANNQLKALSDLISRDEFQNKVGNFLAHSSIEWSFIPPESPHFGGLWESAVKSAKTHMKKVIDLMSLTFEELATVATEIGAVLNSRPLCVLSNDPDDLNPLPPGHFLIGEPMTAIPQEDIQDVPQNRLNRYQLLTQIEQRFWSRWSKEYLSQLQTRPKWKRQVPDAIKPGSLVLLREDETPPLMWRMDRIVEVHPGKDGMIRVVSVKTASNVLKRSIKSISVLPSTVD